MQKVDAAAVTGRDDSTPSAAGERLVGLDIEDQDAVAASPGGDDMDAVDTEDLIGPSAPGRAGPTRTVSHVGVFLRTAAWSLLIVETPMPFFPYATPTQTGQVQLRLTYASPMLNSEEPF